MARYRNFSRLKASLINYYLMATFTASSMKVGVQDNKDKMTQEFWALFNRNLSARFPKET